MPAATFAPEGRIPFSASGEPAETWYKVISDLFNQTQSPLIGPHGELGPGMAHDYLIPLGDLSATRPIILYDQIGNALSTHFSDPPKPATFWTSDLFVDELENRVKFFGLEKRGYYLLGHSWGEILAAEFEVRRHPSHLKGIVLSDLLADMSLWGKSNTDLTSNCKFPAHVQEGLKGGFSVLKKYRVALEEFYKVHACRISPQSKEVAAETGLGGDTTTSLAMNTNALKGWSIVDRLDQFTVPTLIINGRYDISQDFVIGPFDKINKVKWITFENSSHLPM
ncbi:proline iminopeptidase [Mycena albidolilacea]|uniref:Proline iminopeptidase n=1 Tax=Mycena albidolilacea TaxID=1033008 RepID=A0AAD6ZSA5_9AGAR|nr:proline iminopeptidase [Mycena albidolilacea]